MLNLLFGFNMRLSRMHYLLATITLAIVMTALCFAIAGSMPRHLRPSLQTFGWPVIVAGVFFGWATFMLQSMRLRDIGWDPVCIIPLWIAAILVDGLIASRVPAWSVASEGHSTIVGGLINLVLFGAMIFWPSGDNDVGAGTKVNSGGKSSVSSDRLSRALAHRNPD